MLVVSSYAYTLDIYIYIVQPRISLIKRWKKEIEESVIRSIKVRIVGRYKYTVRVCK